jgi:hypothetical protein
VPSGASRHAREAALTAASARPPTCRIPAARGTGPVRSRRPGCRSRGTHQRRSRLLLVDEGGSPGTSFRQGLVLSWTNLGSDAGARDAPTRAIASRQEEQPRSAAGRLSQRTRSRSAGAVPWAPTGSKHHGLRARVGVIVGVPPLCSRLASIRQRPRPRPGCRCQALALARRPPATGQNTRLHLLRA